MAITHGGNIFSAAAEAGLPWQQVLDFSASINPLGPSPAAREAILCALDQIVHYPDRTALALRQRLAAEWRVASGQIIVGNGSTELLYDWCRHMGAGVIAAPAFGEFHQAWPHAVLCDLTRPQTWPTRGPLVLTRPANPTGTLLEADVVLDFARKRSDPILVDESFIDFCDAPSLVPHAHGNLYVLRSLTKFFALPGLRVGALVGSLSELEQSRPPWSVNALAAAAALAALDDSEHASRSKAFVKEEADWLAGRLAALPGVRVWPPSANFLYLQTAHASGLVHHAKQHNILVRDCSHWPGFAHPSVRIAVRRRWENTILLQLCEEFLCAP